MANTPFFDFITTIEWKGLRQNIRMNGMGGLHFIWQREIMNYQIWQRKFVSEGIQFWLFKTTFSAGTIPL